MISCRASLVLEVPAWSSARDWITSAGKAKASPENPSSTRRNLWVDGRDIVSLVVDHLACLPIPSIHVVGPAAELTARGKSSWGGVPTRRILWAGLRRFVDFPGGAGGVRFSVGHHLVDEFLEFAVRRERPNTVRRTRMI